MIVSDFLSMIGQGGASISSTDSISTFVKARFNNFPNFPGRSELVFGAHYVALQQAIMKRTGPKDEMSVCVAGSRVLDLVAAGCDYLPARLRVLCTDLVDPAELSLARQINDLRERQKHELLTVSWRDYFRRVHAELDPYRSSIAFLSVCFKGSAADVDGILGDSRPYLSDDATVMTVLRRDVHRAWRAGDRAAPPDGAVDRDILIDGADFVVSAWPHRRDQP